MSRVEEDAIPYASPLILGHSYILDSKGQCALATLLCLITMRVEFTDRANLVTSQIERTFLMEKLEPPANWKIWIARFAGKLGLELINSSAQTIRF